MLAAPLVPSSNRTFSLRSYCELTSDRNQLPVTLQSVASLTRAFAEPVALVVFASPADLYRTGCPYCFSPSTAQLAPPPNQQLTALALSPDLSHMGRPAKHAPLSSSLAPSLDRHVCLAFHYRSTSSARPARPAPSRRSPRTHSQSVHHARNSATRTHASQLLYPIPQSNQLATRKPPPALTDDGFHRYSILLVPIALAAPPSLR